MRLAMTKSDVDEWLGLHQDPVVDLLLCSIMKVSESGGVNSMQHKTGHCRCLANIQQHGRYPRAR